MSAQTVSAAAPSKGSSLWIQWTLSDHCRTRIVSFAGQVDVTNADYLLDTLRTAMRAGGAKLIFDLSGAHLLDVAGERALLGALRQAARQLVRLDVVCPALIDRNALGALEEDGGFHATLSEALAAQTAG